MKKILKCLQLFFCLVFLLTVTFGLSACNIDKDGEDGENNDYIKQMHDYRIEQKSGNNYITFINISKYEEQGSNQIASLSFSTMDDFVTSVTSGSLKDWQKNVIVNSFERDAYGIKVCDFDNLYVPVMPRKATICGVDWSGESYSFYIEFDDDVFGYLYLYTKEQYQNVYTRDYEEYFNRDSITVTRVEKIDENTTVTYYSTSQADLKQVRYVLSSEGKQFIVDKTYRLKAVNSNFEISESVPSNVTLYCTQGESVYVIDLFGFVSVPTDAWLLKMGITEWE